MTQIWQVSKSQDSRTELCSYYVMIIKLMQTSILVQFVTKKYKVYFVIRTYNTEEITKLYFFDDKEMYGSSYPRQV
jgi:hypothetical protein